MLSTYEKCLESYNDIMTYAKQQPEKFKSMIDRIHRKNKQTCYCIATVRRASVWIWKHEHATKNILLCCHNSEDLLYEFEKMDTFHTRINITRDHTPHEEILVDFNNNNPKH